MDQINGLRFTDDSALCEVETQPGWRVLSPLVRYSALLMLNATSSPVRPTPPPHPVLQPPRSFLPPSLVSLGPRPPVPLLSALRLGGRACARVRAHA